MNSGGMYICKFSLKYLMKSFFDENLPISSLVITGLFLELCAMIMGWLFI